MSNGFEEIRTLINSRRRLILVQTYEESRFIEDLLPLIKVKNYKAYSWTLSSGFYDIISQEQEDKIFDPTIMISKIQESTQPTFYILKDFHDIWDNKQAKRKLRDYIESDDPVYKPIIITSPVFTIPAELEKIVTVVKYDLPSREQIVQELENMEQILSNKDLEVPTGREREAIINSLLGMTTKEVENVLKKSVSKHKKIELSEIVAEKEQVIRKTGLLEYITKLGDMENVGGMDLLKDWLNDAKYAFDEEAKQFKIDPVRGVILCGFPGSGKSLMAKSIAHLWNLPLLKMNMSDIMDSRVGQSEKNIARALKLAEAVSPCVLWIDEMEKGIAGMASSDKSDSGTLSRVVQEMLTWLSEKTAPVFVVATANDISGLKPELTRAGRFDEIFYVSLPHEKERKTIFEIHFKKRGYNINEEISTLTIEDNISSNALEELSKMTQEFSGAEIEQCISEACRKSYALYKKSKRKKHHVLFEDLKEQIEKCIPLSRRNPDLLVSYKKFAKTSAKYASSIEMRNNEAKSQETKKKNRLHVINSILGD
jgi:ATP-dependent 26S proteasome regulatory subunit